MIVDTYAKPSNGGGLDWYCKVICDADMGTFEIAGVPLVYDMQLRNNDSKKQNSGVCLQCPPKIGQNDGIHDDEDVDHDDDSSISIASDFETDYIKAAVNM